MPRREADQGLKPYEIRPGVSIQRFKGMNRNQDPAGMPANAHHLLVNVRMAGGEILERPGSTLEFDSLSASCITGLLETGIGTPSAALWTYNEWYYRDGSIYEGYYSAIDVDRPISLPLSPLAVIFSNQGAAPPLSPTTILPGKVEVEKNSHVPSNRVTGAFLFQNQVVELKSFSLNQITDVKRGLDLNLATGKLQLIQDIQVPAGAAAVPDGDGDRVVRKEFGASPGETDELRDVLYVPTGTGGKLLRYDGVTVSEIQCGAATDQFTTMCVVLGQGLCAIGPTEIAYQANPDASWVVTAHSYSNGAFDAAEWNGQVYFCGSTGPLVTDGTDIVRFTPTTSAVTVVATSTTGTLSDELFIRLTPTKRGLLFFRVSETSGGETSIDIGRISASGVDPTWLHIGIQQDFTPYLLANIVEIGSRIFYSVDATEEFIFPGGLPAWIFNYDNIGAVFEIGTTPSVLDFYLEYGAGAGGSKTGCPVASMPVGPLEVTFG